MVNFYFRPKLRIVEWNRAEKLIVFVRWNVREMAEPTKRTTNNSTSKARKSKNDIIRSKVGTYLKQQSYSVSERKVVLIEISKKFYAEFMFDVHLTSTNLIHTWNVCCMFTYLCLFVVLIMKILGVFFSSDEWKISKIGSGSDANNRSIWVWYDDCGRFSQSDVIFVFKCIMPKQ